MFAHSGVDPIQNAMNAAEITDKLGLHSLRQRAWVCCDRNSGFRLSLTRL